MSVVKDGGGTASGTSVSASWGAGGTLTAGQTFVVIGSSAGWPPDNELNAPTGDGASPSVSQVALGDDNGNRSIGVWTGEAAGGETGFTLTKEATGGSQRMSLIIIADDEIDIDWVLANLGSIVSSKANNNTSSTGPHNTASFDPTPTGEGLFVAAYAGTGNPGTLGTPSNSFAVQEDAPASGRAFALSKTDTNPGSTSTGVTSSNSIQHSNYLLFFPYASITDTELVVADAVSGSLADEPTPTAAHLLAVADAVAATLADNVDLGGAALLVVADAVAAATADGPTLTQLHVLVVSAAVAAALADGVAVTQAHALVVADAVAVATVDGVVLAVAGTDPHAVTLTVLGRGHTATVRAGGHTATRREQR